MNWKRSIIFCVSFLTVFFGEIVVNVACGGEIDPYDYYISYFHNDVQGKDYDQFNFSEWEYLYHDEEKVDEYDLNSAEWAKYLNVKKEDVRSVMYDSDSTSNVLLANLTKKNLKQLPQDLQGNAFVKALAKNKHALKYFAFAKSCEPLATANYDPWNPVMRDSTQMIAKAEQAIKQLVEVRKDNFLKLRYAYQAARMYHYAESYAACKAVYKQYIEPIASTDLAKGWAMSVYAGSVRYGGDPTEAAYLFSKVFNSNPERRVQAYKNFHYTSAAVEDVLAFTQSDEEKAQVIAIKSFGNPDFDLASLNKVYSYIPSSLMNGTLLVREVNKLEKYFNKPGGFSRNYDDTDNRSTTKNTNLSQLELTKSFALKLAAEKKYPEPELGIISAAYLNWLKKDDVAAAALLQKLNPSTLKARYQNQYQIITLLLNARKIKQGTFKANDLVPTLKWLDERCKEKVAPKEDDYFASNRENKFLSTTRNFYHELLVPTYMKMGDTTRAALLMLKGDLDVDTTGTKGFSAGMSWTSLEFWQNYLSSSTLSKLEKRFNEKAAGDFDVLLNRTLSRISKNDFYELYGTAYLREHQYQKALKCFENLPANYEFLTPSDWYEDEKLYANPFETTINDYPKRYTSATKKYDKKSFAKEMVRLQKLVSTDKKNAAQHYFRMANGVYQTGYYGNAWALISYNWSSYAVYEKSKYAYDQDFKMAATAKKWYLKARSLSTDVEFKAKCTFMLAKCEQKSKSNQVLGLSNWYDISYTERDNRLAYVNSKNAYFAELKQHYGQTAYYKKAAYECSYLSDFVVPTK
ncbi:hypothetical protein [Pedobacter xixiisoli]|uniref:Tetratricopeptide repeat-containing protein n=1 Tax=Pedobacter xixiisoli TaxID=1476464 RepID=A0A286A7R7_9SPHI|nr:hypothetical protein [Pedobacter xixiisoli]SOD17887.1 hypothetical protein SAMN06297358_2730 [Pedobacter xixiisoli]